MSLDSLEGDLQQIRLPKVLFILGVQEANGILTVQGEDDIVAVSFVQGAIVTADALNQTVEDGLGKVLQGKGWVSPEQFNAAAREHQGGSTGSLGDLLVDKGAISRQQLLEALRLQTLRSMLQLLTWKTGDFKFYSGDEVSFEDGFVPIGADELILRAVSKLGDKAGLVGSIPDDQTIYRAVPPRGPVKVIGRDGDGLGAGIWVSPLQASFLSKVTGQASNSDISRSLGLSRQQLLFTLYHLLQFDLIESAGRKSAAAAGPSRPGTEPFASPTAAPPGTSSAGTIPFADSPPGAGQPMMAPQGPGADPSGLAMPPGMDPSGTLPRPRAEFSGTAVPRPNMDGSGAGARGSGVLPRTAAQVFLPPEPTAAEPVESDDRLLDWAGPILAAILLIGAGLTVLSRPVSLILPFPWQENPRSTVERQARESLFQRIDRGARTHFLMEAHYPDSLKSLQELSLISNVDHRGPAGNELEYLTEEVSYSIRMRRGDQVIEGLGTMEAITGDFLVDPQFLGTAATAEDPVVLLD